MDVQSNNHVKTKVELQTILNLSQSLHNDKNNIQINLNCMAKL